MAATVEQNVKTFRSISRHLLHTPVGVVRAGRFPLCADPPCGLDRPVVDVS